MLTAALTGMLLCSAARLSAQVTVQIPDTAAFRGTQVSMPVSLAGVGGEGIVSVEIFITYDPLLVSFSDGNTAGSLVRNWLFDKAVAAGGTRDTLKLAGATVYDTIRTDGVVYTVDFAVADRRTATTAALTLDHVLLNDGNPAAQPASGSIKITGVDGTLQALPDTVTRNQPLRVMVVDADEDRTGGPDSIVVHVRNGEQTETLIAAETGDHSGQFAGEISAEFSSGVTPSGDGIVQLSQGDTVSFCYQDLLDSLGEAVPRCDTALVAAGTLGAVDATVVLQPADTLRVRVMDPDLDNTAGRDTVTVTATNSRTQEQQSAVLEETEEHSGIFMGGILTAFGTGGTGQEGVLTVQRADTVRIAYEDAAPGVGAEQVLYDTCLVVDPWGDASGNGRLGALDAARILSHDLGLLTLTGLDSLAANVDLQAPFGPITAYDASLVLQRRVGIIDHFPVQEAGSADHPQADTTSAAPRPAAGAIPLALEVRERGLALMAADRSAIVSGRMRIDDFTGSVSMAMEGFALAVRREGGGLSLVFAGSRPAGGAGPVLWIHPGPGDRPRVRDVSFDDGRWVGRLEEGPGRIRPRHFALHACYPNPFNPETTIRYDLPAPARVQLDVFDMLGQQVRTLVCGDVAAGSYRVQWDGRDEHGRSVAGGIYLARLTAGDLQAVRKMVLLK